MSIVLVALVAASILYALWKFYRFTANYPPGPFPLPFVGNLHQVDLGSRQFCRFANKFKGLYTVFVPIPTLEITDYSLIKEAFIDHGEDYVERNQLPILDDILTYCKNGGVINSSGDNWREQRRTALSILRDFGMGRNVMEEKIMIANIINEVLFGYLYTLEDCDGLVNFVEEFDDLLQGLASSYLLPLAISFPFIRRVPLLGYYAVDQHADKMRKIHQYVIDNVDRTLKAYDPEAEPRNFVHAYTQRMNGNAFLDQANLIQTCIDFFSAGQETTSTTLRWAMLFLADNQPQQNRLREEIHQTIGRDKLPALADKNNMLYAQATLHEVQRLANILRYNVFRKTHKPTEIAGHKLPAGMTIHADIHYVMWNDPHFVDPKEFLPERYISADGKSLRKDLVDRTIPFSIGRRSCAGEGLARIELFLALTATIQHYRILPMPGRKIDLTQQALFIGGPKDQELTLERV
ncbi:hypothetical protein PRIPAC_80004 [Pristionchus pacificus]|uniref:Cytochrome P450 n=1 Tax=Pristionchus pacificus TaxID=54126 RepID=A0A2A6CLA0_PRIPA|nr:hypothetical protein PRIPAC_80004 [Pristionchus pacificus]|eukprot:PDM79015.1 cytochrome P450 [Pristionchus pacificus]